ncbi:MAG: hypothetical protein ABIG71_04335 [Candidatus Uhrbacteria bacterium]
MRFLSLPIFVCIALVACTIPIEDTRDGNCEDCDDDAVHDDDVATDDDAVDDDVADDDASMEYVITCSVANEANVTAVNFCSNFTPPWDCADPVNGSTATWSGMLDADRLALAACGAGCVGCQCGYEFNVWFPEGLNWLLTRGTDGNAQAAGSCTITSPDGMVEASLTPSTNNIGGYNYHVHSD